jgi:cell volume regulation protein A
VNVIVRGQQAVPPRGSTRIRADDQLHLLVREEAARAVDRVVATWREGPVGPRPLARPVPLGRPPLFHVRAWDEGDGDAARPQVVAGREVADQLRTRTDSAGALVLLDDGSFAVTGATLAVGARRRLAWWARRRLELARLDPAERAWWEEVIGALAR